MYANLRQKIQPYCLKLGAAYSFTGSRYTIGRESWLRHLFTGSIIIHLCVWDQQPGGKPRSNLGCHAMENEINCVKDNKNLCQVIWAIFSCTLLYLVEEEEKG